MKEYIKISDKNKEMFFLIIRILFCFTMLWNIITLLGMGGNISDWYSDEKVLSLVQDTFLCNDGVWIAAGLLLLFVLIDICQVCKYLISKYLLEKSSMLTCFRLYKAIWITIMCIVSLVMVLAYKTMQPYYQAVSSIAPAKSQEEIEEIIVKEKCVLIYVMERNCKVCSDVTQQLLKLLPETGNIIILRYELSEMGGNIQSDKATKFLKNLSVESVPSLVFLKDGIVVKLIEGMVDDNTMKNHLMNF